MHQIWRHYITFNKIWLACQNQTRLYQIRGIFPYCCTTNYLTFGEPFSWSCVSYGRAADDKHFCTEVLILLRFSDTSGVAYNIFTAYYRIQRKTILVNPSGWFPEPILSTSRRDDTPQNGRLGKDDPDIFPQTHHRSACFHSQPPRCRENQQNQQWKKNDRGGMVSDHAYSTLYTSTKQYERQ